MSCILHDETLGQTCDLLKCSRIHQSTNANLSSTGWITGRVIHMIMHEEVKVSLEDRLPA